MSACKLCGMTCPEGDDRCFSCATATRYQRVQRVQDHKDAYAEAKAVYEAPTARSIYVIGSMRNPRVLEIGNALRTAGLDCFDDWVAGGPESDDRWREYEMMRGRSYKEALSGHAARHIFEYDKSHLDRCDATVLVAPAGKSAHLELGYMIGSGKKGYILLDDPERWDVMYLFATAIVTSVEELLEVLK